MAILWRSASCAPMDTPGDQFRWRKCRSRAKLRRRFPYRSLRHRTSPPLPPVAPDRPRGRAEQRQHAQSQRNSRHRSVCAGLRQRPARPTTRRPTPITVARVRDAARFLSPPRNRLRTRHHVPQRQQWLADSACRQCSAAVRPNAQGSLIFGIGTQPNNGLVNAAVYGVTAAGPIPELRLHATTAPLYPGSISSGANANYFLDSAITGFPALHHQRRLLLPEF